MIEIGRGLGAAAVLVLSVAACSGNSSTSSPSPTSSAGESVFAATPLPTPRTTPPGTPGPIPDVAIATSAEIKTPTPKPNATATPAPEAGIWRIQGYVVDEDGKPVESACVVIGPNGCRDWSPKTDEQGHYFIDVAEGGATFDFYFEIPGRNTVWLHITPAGPSEYNVILTKA